MLAAIIGISTVVVGTAVKVLGFPDQFRKNLLRKSTHGVSTIFYLLALLSYVLWTVHGVIQKDNVLIIGQGIGVLTTIPIVWQIWIYRKNNPTQSNQ